MVLELIDMDADGWRGRFKRGDTWRSKTAAACGVCGCKSNLWFMGGYPGMGPRLACPGREAFSDLHEELEKIDQVELNGSTYHSTSYLPKSVIAEIMREIERDRAKFRNVRPDVITEASGSS